MEIGIFNITVYLYGVLTVIKQRESAGMSKIDMNYISACRVEALPEYTQVEDFFCSSHPFAMNGQEGTCLRNCSSDKRFYISYLQ